MGVDRAVPRAVPSTAAVGILQEVVHAAEASKAMGENSSSSALDALLTVRCLSHAHQLEA
jgi:hypothetical protein